MADPHTVAADLERAAKRAYRDLDNVVARYSQLALAKVRANASGRPGPRRITGDYTRSMNVTRIGPFARSIGTNAVQGPRLENGFVGTDAIGRVYHQPPYAHFGPMATWIDPQFTRAVDETIGRVG